MSSDSSQVHSSLPSKTSALNLRQSLASAQEGNQANDTSGREHLKQGPAVVVEEEDALHREDRAEEEAVGDGRSACGLLEVGEVGSEIRPLILR